MPTVPAAARRHAVTPTRRRRRTPVTAPQHLTTIDLTRFDLILVDSSAGKDSQATLDVVANAAAAAGVLDRVTVLHCDLGHVEWPGVIELATAQAAHYGVPIAVRRHHAGLLNLIHQRGRWPSPQARYCTSATKRQPARRYMTERVAALNLGRPAWILNCLGMRAEESTARAKKRAFAFDPSASNITRRKVWTWLPVHAWTEHQVWTRIHASRAPYHPAYDLGMRRLSCTLCPLAARADLVRACQLRPDAAHEYLDLEDAIGHDFRPGLALRDVYAEAVATAGPHDPITTGIALDFRPRLPLRSLNAEAVTTSTALDLAGSWSR
ncbi:phosphoadenosine phosphosulfate reductase family protein [Dactylosporangium sp. NPDC051485]|uniref:phosphoadenosine phosphosulfate reductase family protein n=1 Tax=Dactylosporangium sp. NPDC051485 TaxID=3154846 RepID=UPI0034310BC7